VEAAKILSLIDSNNPESDGLNEVVDPWYYNYGVYLETKESFPDTILDIGQLVTRAEMTQMIYKLAIFTGEYVQVNESGYYFNTDDYNVYWYESGIGNYTEIVNANRSSFEVLDYYYGKDQNNVYYEDDIIEEANLETFEVIGSSGETESFFYAFAKDDSQVFNFDTVIPGADPDSFELVEGSEYYYAKDAENVYWLWDSKEALENSDPASFEVITWTRGSSAYAKDNNNVYCNATEIPWTGQIFELIEGGEFVEQYEHARVDDQIFYNCELIPEADVDSFETCPSKNGGYAQDANNYYYNGEVIDPENDPEVLEYCN
jgi:hypothetical protein